MIINVNYNMINTNKEGIVYDILYPHIKSDMRVQPMKCLRCQGSIEPRVHRVGVTNRKTFILIFLRRWNSLVLITRLLQATIFYACMLLHYSVIHDTNEQMPIQVYFNIVRNKHQLSNIFMLLSIIKVYEKKSLLGCQLPVYSRIYQHE